MLTGTLPGFANARRSFVFDQRPRQADFVMQVGAVQETVTVTADVPVIDMRSSESLTVMRLDEISSQNAQEAPRTMLNAAPSANVQSLQRRAAGVLPVRVDVPRSGASHRFVKPLVVDEETIVSFRYRRVGA